MRERQIEQRLTQAVRKRQGLCPKWVSPGPVSYTHLVRRFRHHLHGHKRRETMGAFGKLRPEIRGEHRSGDQPGHSVLCHAGAAGLRDCGACPRRGDPRSRSRHVAGSRVRADGQDAALGTGPSAARGRVRDAVL